MKTKKDFANFQKKLHHQRNKNKVNEENEKYVKNQ